MSAPLPTCVNHPDAQTRISCSSCDDPICTRCMRQGAVGQKCPRCAAVPLRARGLGKPIHYVRGAGAGLAVGLAAGAALALLLTTVGVGSLIGAWLLGIGVARAVGWGAPGLRQQPFPAIAAACAVLGVALALVVATRTPVPSNVFLLLAYPLAGYRAWRGVEQG